MDGETDGTRVGLREGELDIGTLVGMYIGSLEGFNVGFLEGFLEGFLVGLGNVGSLVGLVGQGSMHLVDTGSQTALLLQQSAVVRQPYP